MTKRRSIKLIIVAFWALTVGWLVRYEAFPELFAHSLAGYRGLFSSGPMILDNWMKITFNDSHIGYSHTQVMTRDREAGQQYILQNRSVIDLMLMGSRQRVNITAEASLDAVYRLQDFSFVMSARRYVVELKGKRVRGEQFDIDIDSGEFRQTVRVNIPDDVLIYSPMLEMTMKNLPPGDSLTVKVFDPMSLTVSEMVMTAERRETVEHEGEPVETTVLAAEYQGMRFYSWLDADGQVLRQETPLGWTMISCRADEAMSMDGAGQVEVDMMEELAVRCEGIITDPRQCRELTIQLGGMTLESALLQTSRQQVLRRDGEAVDLKVTMEDDARDEPGQAWSREELAPFLRASPFIQSGDARIRDQALKILGDDAGDPLRSIEKLGDWVFREVEKNPTASLPSALDVLRQREGDCNEHTYLFVALARSVGIPAQVRIGLLYNEGAFYYHAWPSVYAGRWIDMDPTLGQTRADATHIALLQGELADQLRLLSVVGRIDAKVLAQKYDE